MTLLDIKKQVLSMLEEENTAGVATDPDILAKMNYVINLIQKELSKIVKIRTKTTFTYSTTYEFTLPNEFYQVDKINCNYEIYDGKILLDTTEATMDMYYYKHPTLINAETLDTAVLEVSQECLDILPYGVIADLTKGDPSDIYKDYASRYNEGKNKLIADNATASVYLDTTNAINETLTEDF